LVDLLASATAADRQMPDRTGLSNIFAATVNGRSSTGPDQFRLPATGDGAVNAETAADRELADLSLAGLVLLPVTIFVVTLLTIDFLLGANYVATIWPANAIVLVALLRHRRNPRNYGSIIVGSACAIALANAAVGNSAASSAIFGVANIFEVAVTLAFLSVLPINAANLAGDQRVRADELLVRPVSPKALYEHVSRIVLRKNQANPPTAFVQNQRRRDELHKKKTGDLALL
jgi:hypothetical protein